jgi:glycosyltransferase involved in cell wall biosynthesis
MAPKLCLNMIVKNEAARMARCLASVADHIACYAIVDTGSTDGTPEIIKDFFHLRGIPGRVAKAPFINFAQARNQALIAARNVGQPWDYLLLTDADMEFVAEKGWADDLTAPAYMLVQKSGCMSYWNTRLIKHGARAQYYGVTHEYLSVDGVERLEAASYVDHGDGSNRENKVERDIALLRDGLHQEPSNARYWFYLAQSYREFDPKPAAIAAYRRCIETSGWDEEKFYAQWQLARLLKETGKDAEFIATALAASNTRSTRGEALYDLAKYYREKGQNTLALIYAKAGLALPFPKDDLLFVDEFIHNFGFKEEFSIAGFYDPNLRPAAFDVCNELALSAKAPAHVRDTARGNLFHYLQPLSFWASSVHLKRMEFFDTDKNYTSTNPSVTVDEHGLLVNVRTVNYKIDAAGYYHYPDGDTAIRTNNWLVRVDEDLVEGAAIQILPPPDMPAPYTQVLGFEDMRIFVRGGKELWFNACVRQLNADGICQQVLGKAEQGYVTHYEVLKNDVSPVVQNEKNWMPLVMDIPDNDLFFAYRPNVIINDAGNTTRNEPVDHAIENFSGSSQIIPFEAGFLGVVHEARIKPGHTKRFYQHRFIWWDANLDLRRVSMPFFLVEKGIEFNAGLCEHPDGKRLVLSFGVDDSQAWLATLSKDDVRGMLWFS